MTQSPVFIYILYDPISSEPRYVGQTTQPKMRLTAHLSGKGNTGKSQWIASLRAANEQPILVVIDAVDGDRANQAEVDTIENLRSLGFNLLNDACRTHPHNREQQKTPKLSVQAMLDPEDRQALDQLVADLDLTASQVVRRALRELAKREQLQ